MARSYSSCFLQWFAKGNSRAVNTNDAVRQYYHFCESVHGPDGLWWIDSVKNHERLAEWGSCGFLLQAGVSAGCGQRVFALARLVVVAKKSFTGA
jgi:hypothetical protein